MECIDVLAMLRPPLTLYRLIGNPLLPQYTHIHTHTQEKCQAYSFLAQRMNTDLMYDEGKQMMARNRDVCVYVFLIFTFQANHT